MTQILSPYNSLLHIHQAKLINMDKKVYALKCLIRKYHFQHFIGIYRLHKHFDLLPGERVFWQKTGRNQYQAKVVKEENLGTPMVYGYFEGKWEPTEYQMVNTQFWEKVTASDKFGQFEKEFKTIVGDQLNLIGLGLNPKDTAPTLETTDQKQRTQKVREYDTEVQDATITKWMADSDCDEGCICTGFGHCTHCRHICGGSYH